MAKVNYQLELWQIRSKLLKKGIHKPAHEMVKAGYLKPPTSNYTDNLNGRVEDKKFLDAIKKYENSLD